jgi:DNA polymerase-1
MKPELIVIDNPRDIKNSLTHTVRRAEYIAFDTETTGLTKQDSIIGMSFCTEVDRAYYVVLERYDALKQVLAPTGCREAVAEILEELKSKKLIMHNSIFDCMMVEANFKVNLMPSTHTDTMILAHLLNENRRVGLKELGKSIFGEDSADEAKEMKESVLHNGGKLTKTQYEMWKCDSQIMGKYGAKDALLTYKLFTYLVPILFEQGLEEFFYDLESMPLLRGPTYQLNTVGLCVDSSMLGTLKKTLEAECEEAKAFIYKEISLRFQAAGKEAFNIGAPQQLSWLLFGEYGLEFGNLTKAGKEVCKALDMKLPYYKAAQRTFIAECQRRLGQQYTPDAMVNGKLKKGKKIREPWAYIAADKKILQKYATKYKWIAKLLEYQKKMKLLSTYVEGIEERLRYGTIQPSFLQHGTSSGRYSSRSPNLQNLPRDDKRIKECFVARPGQVFVGADYSQLEPRVFAAVSADKRLCESFEKREDFYSVVGREVYDKLECLPLKEDLPGVKARAFGAAWPKFRQDAKTFTLASTYGATGFQLSPMMGKSADDAQKDIDKYFETFPAVRTMMLDSHTMAKRDGQVLSLFGRPRRIPEAKKIDKLYGTVRLPYEARKLLNLAVNHRIQSTAASIVNRAAIRFYVDAKQAGIDCKIVLQVHDSLIIECSAEDVENVSALLRNAMENTVELPGVKLEAVPKIGKNLSQV